MTKAWDFIAFGRSTKQKVDTLEAWIASQSGVLKNVMHRVDSFLRNFLVLVN